jgi:hypothetical protein
MMFEIPRWISPPLRSKKVFKHIHSNLHRKLYQKRKRTPSLDCEKKRIVDENWILFDYRLNSNLIITSLLKIKFF